MFCGLSGDEYLAYQTLKVVRIKDYRLGCLYYTFIFLILCWVLGYQILYANEHFEKLDVEGAAQLTIQQPTLHGCNPNNPSCRSAFTPLTQLPYCKEYRGNTSQAQVAEQRECLFADRHTLNPLGEGEGELLVPTRLDLFYEQRGCQPNATNGFNCDNEWNIVKRTDVVYIADIEHATIKIAHAYGRGDVSGYSPNVPRTYLECAHGGLAEDRRFLPLDSMRSCPHGYRQVPIECISSSCPFLRDEAPALPGLLELQADQPRRAGPAARRGLQARGGRLTSGLLQAGGPQPEAGAEARGERLRADGVYAIPEGDVFSVGKLLEIAGVSLDDTRDRKGRPARETGTVIEVSVVYSNLHPFSSTFGDKRVSYEYHIRQRPVGEMKTEMVSDARGGGRLPDSRVIEDRHGVLIVVRIGGSFGFLSTMYVLIMLTTALGLLTGATFLTDKLAIYLMRKAEYLGVMIESTEPLNK